MEGILKEVIFKSLSLKVLVLSLKKLCFVLQNVSDYFLLFAGSFFVSSSCSRDKSGSYFSSF